MKSSAQSAESRTSLCGLRCRLTWRSAFVGLASAGFMLALSWFIVHEVPGAGSWVADSLRRVVGVDRVARLEDAIYAARDSVNRVVRAGQKPRSYWKTEAHAPAAHRPVVVDAAVDAQPHVSGAQEPSWRPADVEAPFAEVAAEGDGVWVPVGTKQASGVMFKTLLHPDPERSWAELFIVAIDARATKLHWVPGTQEPRSLATGAEEMSRPGRIPMSADPQLIAAFNGGFKTVHGRFGAAQRGVTMMPPCKTSCTIWQQADGALRVGTFAASASVDSAWMRQTPPCMVEDGQLHPGLVRTDNTNWGATLDGKTVIRRSALGLSADGKTLFVGISNDTTARALALGMRQAGAQDVAQLDVNYAYPKFVLSPSVADSEERPRPQSLVEGFVMRPHQYLEPESRDFFYLTRRLDRQASVPTLDGDAG